MTAADRLAEIEARIEAATEGPWEVIGGGEYVTGVGVGIGVHDGGIRPADATFIAHTRTDVPWLVEQVIVRDEALRAVLALHEAVEVHEYDDTNGVFAVDADGNHIVTHRLCRECTPDYTLELLGDCEWTEDAESVHYPCATVVTITEALDGAR